MARRYCYKDVLPFTAMVAVECTNVGLNTLFKAATLQGMSYFVFIFYSYAIATLFLLPFPFILRRTTMLLPPLNTPILSRILLLGLIGLLAEIVSYKGIEYSSPTLASALSNLTAAFTFILAIIFRMESINLRSWSTCAKILGTIVSIAGALVVVLYNGPTILSATSPPSISFHRPLASSSPGRNWVIGGLLLASENLLFSLWNIVQVMEMYPAELTVSLLYNLCLTIMCLPVCLIAVRDPSSWRLRLDIALASYVYSGIFGSLFSTVVQSWALHLKGPVYVSLFKPFSIAVAAVLGIVFLGDAIYLGSVVGVVIISVGFYGVLWGKAKEEESESRSKSKVPLLQEEKDVMF